jgi:RNA polymerase sigma-70 factor (ECF subfamily)
MTAALRVTDFLRVDVGALRLRLVKSENQAEPNHAPFVNHIRGVAATKSTWPDAWLINAVRVDPPDEEALNALVDRYWKPLYARCRMLTLDPDGARDLAQESWLRVLKARHSIQPDGHFQAYVITIATNLWRDTNRAALRAGPMADHRVASLDAATRADDDESITLGNILADPHTLSQDDQLLLEMDLDQGLARLNPRLRDVLIARYVSGESAAEIGERYDRTEQAVTGWIREAIRQMRIFLGDESGRASRAGDR